MKNLSLPVVLPNILLKYIALGLSCFSFVVPFFLGQPQFLVGTMVNAGLFSSAILLPERYFWPIVLLPSLGVLLRGAIFGPMTPFLIYFLPFIWLGNLVLIKIFKKFYLRSGFATAMLTAAIGKQVLLYLSAEIYFGLHLVPKMFLQSMGLNQLMTAVSGGLIAYGLFFYARRNARG